MMKINELMKQLDEIAPFKDSEDWDNTGLLVGDGEDEVTGVLTTLDCSLETVDEAIGKDLNTIVFHQQIILQKVNSITKHYNGRIIRKLMKNDINLITIHTYLHRQPNGVIHMISEALG